MALTGSDTASNVLFGGLQKITAQQLGLSPILMGAANSSGGVMGKMIDAQSIVVASTATNWFGHEGTILRFVFGHSIALADTGLNDGEVRVLLALNALDWNEKGWSEHSEETMAGLIGKKVRQFRNILTLLRKKDKVFQQRRGDHKTAKLYPKVRVEGNAVVNGHKRD